MIQRRMCDPPLLHRNSLIQSIKMPCDSVKIKNSKKYIFTIYYVQ